jgi:hypothetical protein
MLLSKGWHVPSPPEMVSLIGDGKTCDCKFIATRVQSSFRKDSKFRIAQIGRYGHRGGLEES